MRLVPSRPSSLSGVLVGAATIVAWVIGAQIHVLVGVGAALVVIVCGIFLPTRS